MYLIVLFVVGLLLWYVLIPKRLQSIHGPRAWPIVGNVLQFDMARPFLTTAEWAKKYGNIYKLSIAGTTSVVVTGTEGLNEVLKEKGSDFADRDLTFRMVYSTQGSDIVFSKYNEKWKQMRKLLFQGLKQHNLKRIETISQEVIGDFVYDIDALKGKAFDLFPFIMDSMLQILYVMIFSVKVEKTSKDIELIKKVELLGMKGSAIFGAGTLLDVFPFLRFFGNQTYKELEESVEIIRGLYSGWKNKIDSGEVGDCWFKNTLEHSLKESVSLDEDNMMMMTMDFFGAGLTTSSSTLLTFMNVLVHYPDVQKRLAKEVDDVVGQDRCVSLNDRDNMPYARACILEVMR